jgi:acetyl-CoA carboxylase biotin carboxyl carrier protein
MKYDIKQIRELADLATEKGLAELTVEDGEQAISIRLHGAQTVVTHAAPVQAAPAQAASTTPAAKPAADDDSKYHKVTAPMVGTFYASPSPESPPYTSVGQAVSKGQTLCIIEAMKMMNELEAEVSGTVVKILTDNGQPVEFGQPLFLIQPN